MSRWEIPELGDGSVDRVGALWTIAFAPILSTVSGCAESEGRVIISTVSGFPARRTMTSLGLATSGVKHGALAKEFGADQLNVWLVVGWPRGTKR
jgi:hypothetical protein